jgi:DedD protein
MALFKNRKKADEPVAAATPAESVDAMRRRARHRLIGAVVLVLAGVVGFPLLFDTQPRPVSVDIPIEIPDRNKVKPLPLPPQAPVAAGKVITEPAPVITEPKAEAKPETKVAEAKPEVVTPPPVEKKPEPKPEPRPEAKPEPKPDATEAAKARALLEGKTVDTAANGTRYVVQVGAFADVTKAREARQKVERAGLKTYTNVAETKDGRRIRVRAGPFASRDEAARAAEKIKGLDLPAAILTL